MLERGDVPGFAARLETFMFDFAHENLQGETIFRALLLDPRSPTRPGK